MTDLSTVASSATAFVTSQTAALKKTAGDATASFEGALSKVKSAIAGKPATGFTGGPTYEAGTLAGKTKTAFDSAIGAATSALHSKP